MDTFAELLASGDAGLLTLALTSLGAGAVLAVLAVHLRPRPRRRAAR